ncbi:MAG: hypothetical protein IT267_05630 [Saprospiraceae bacterium]|nr:hypothetical protein [Saprospiraceae bacterium]
MSRKALIIVTLVLVVVGAGISFYYYNKPTQSLHSLGVDYKLTAKNIFQEFEDNEELATQKYLNKVCEITGLFDTLLSNEQGAKVVLLNSEGGMGALSFELDSTIQSASNYPKGQIITLKGICSGKLIDIIFNRSIIVYN